MVEQVELLPTPPGPVKLQGATDNILFRLAYEFARDIYAKEDILAAFNLDEEYFQNHVLPNKTYQTYYAEAKVLWTSSLNSAERIQVKASVAFEEALETLANDLINTKEPLSGRVRLAELLTRISGVEKDIAKPLAAGEGVSINISFVNAGKPAVSYEPKPPVPVTVDVLAVKVPDGTN